MDRRSFLSSMLGLAATPLIKPKSFFFFGNSYKIGIHDIRFNGPFLYGDGRWYLRGVAVWPHVKDGRTFDGFWAVRNITSEGGKPTPYWNQFKKDIMEKINWFREEQIKGSIIYTESPVVNKFKS